MSTSQAAPLALAIAIGNVIYYLIASRGKDEMGRNILQLTCSTSLFASILTLAIATALF